MSQPIESEAPPTYLFAVALSIVAGVLLLVGSLRLVGAWNGEAVLVLLLRVAALIVLGLGVRLLIGRELAAVRFVLIGLGLMWFSALFEGVFMWTDLGWFLRRLTDEAVFGALAGALILSVPVVVLLYVRPTREHLRRART